MSESNTEANKFNTPNTEANKEEEKKEKKREYMREYMRRKRQEQREKEETEKEDLGEALAQNKGEDKKKGGWKEYMIIAVIAGIILLMPFLQNYIQPILAKLNLRKNNEGAWE